MVNQEAIVSNFPKEYFQPPVTEHEDVQDTINEIVKMRDGFLQYVSDKGKEVNSNEP